MFGKMDAPKLDFFFTKASVHRSLDIKQSLVRHNVTIVEHPLYMFSRLSIALIFPVSVKEVMKDVIVREYEVTENAKKILKDLKNDFQEYFQILTNVDKCMQLPKGTTLNKNVM